MQGKVVKIRKRARQMSDPHPQFVSLVPGGSNGTPIRAMKADNIEEIDVATNLKRGDVSIARFTFDGAAFKSDSDVTAWLEAGGYDIPAIVAVKGESFNGFTVASKEQPDDLREIDLGNGVIAFLAVGAKAEASDIAAPRGHVTAVNGQEAAAAISTGAQAAATASKGADEVDPNAETITDPAAQVDAGAAPAAGATAEAVPAAEAGQSTKDDAADTVADPGPPPALLSVDEQGFPTLVTMKSCGDITDLAQVLQALSWLKSNVDYRTYNGTYTAEIATAYRAVIKSVGELLTNITAATVADATKSEDADAGTTEQAAEPAAESAEAADETSGAVPGEGGEATGEGNATQEAPAAQKSDDPIATLTALVTTLAGQVSALSTTVAQSTSKAEDAIRQVAELTGTAPARKSADVEDMAAASPSQHKTAEKSESEKLQDRNSLALLGMR